LYQPPRDGEQVRPTPKQSLGGIKWFLVESVGPEDRTGDAPQGDDRPYGRNLRSVDLTTHPSARLIGVGRNRLRTVADAS
jgi:hypothetical protein